MKKTVRLLSVLVAIAVVCSALFALAACGPKEFTVTYHNWDGEQIGTEVVEKKGFASGRVDGYQLQGSIYDMDGNIFALDTPIEADTSLKGHYIVTTTWVDDQGKNYTWRSAPTTIPSNWNYHTYQSNEATYILNYTSDSLYTFDYNETGDAFQIVPSMAKEMPVDVSDEYAAKFGYETGLEGKAYRIVLKDNLRYDNGEAINAHSFVRSVKNLLNPAAANSRAGELYATGDLKILGAEKYLKQGTSTWEDVTGGAGVGSGDFAGWYTDEQINAADGCTASIRDAVIPAGLAENLVFDLNNSYVGKWAQSSYADYVAAWGLFGFFTNGFGVAPVEDIEALNGKTLAEILASDALTATMDAFLVFWCTDKDEPAGFFVQENVWADYDFADVGFFAEEGDDYSLVIVLIDELPNDFWLKYNLATSFFLVNNTLYESCASEANGVYTNDYATSIAKYSGYGPYMLTEYVADNSFKLERNPYWHGYFEEELAGQYQTTAIQYTVVTDDETRLNMFLAGQLEGYGLRAEDMDDYGASKYTYYDDSESTWFMVLNPDTENLATTAAAATPKTAGNTVIKQPLVIEEFRQALSYSLDRTAFCLTLSPTSSAAKGALSSMIVYDPEEGKTYRSTEEAKDAILEFWGLSDEWGPGKTYETKDDAIDAITGYDPAGAKALFTTAYDKAVENGWIPEGDTWELQICVGANNWGSSFYANGYEFLSSNWVEAVKGTPWEGHLVFVQSASLGNGWSDALRNGSIDMLFGVGWGGSMFDPYSMLECFVREDLAYDTFTNKNAIMLDIEIDGQTLRASLADWLGKCLGGDPIEAKIIGEDGEPTGETKSVNAGLSAPSSLRLKILAACEVACLKICNTIPLMTDASASMRCMRVNYKTEDYILGLGRGGIQYYTYTMTDEEFAAFVQQQGGTLDYTVTE